MAGMPSMDTPQELDQLLTVETDNGVLFKICLGVALFYQFSTGRKAPSGAGYSCRLPRPGRWPFRP